MDKELRNIDSAAAILATGTAWMPALWLYRPDKEGVSEIVK